MAKIAIYARVSVNERTVENQLRDLRAWAGRCGHEIVAEYLDEGVSGTKGRDQRPGFDAMLRDAARRHFDLVAAWSVDRLGRSLQDLVSFLGELRGAGVDLFLHQQALDTSTPAGKAMFGMLGIFAEFEASMIKARVHAGLARARAAGRVGGRPRVGADVEAAIRASLAAGTSIDKTAKLVGVGVSTVMRIRGDRPAS